MLCPMHRRRLLLGLPVFGLAHGAYAQTPPASAALPVAASFSILGDMLHQIGGDRLALRVIVGPDTDAHGFQPRRSDAEALRGAALLVRNGLGFDAWVDRLARAATRNYDAYEQYLRGRSLLNMFVTHTINKQDLDDARSIVESLADQQSPEGR